MASSSQLDPVPEQQQGEQPREPHRAGLDPVGQSVPSRTGNGAPVPIVMVDHASSSLPVADAAEGVDGHAGVVTHDISSGRGEVLDRPSPDSGGSLLRDVE